jgi:glutamate racemase
MNNRPIGIFDSGLGGLTVASEVMRLMPNESIVYLGDTARVPYGARSHETVIQYAKECIDFLQQHDVKMVVIACGTASATALSTVQLIYDMPIVGVITPGAVGAIEVTNNRRIGVIGTAATIKSGAHRKVILQHMPEATVFEQACPLFVPLAEEGWGDGEIARLTAEQYLTELRQHDVDSVILGCTHYPLLRKSIEYVMGDKVTLIDPAIKTAQEVKHTLKKLSIQKTANAHGKQCYYVTDYSQRFKEIGSRFLGSEMGEVKKATIPFK